MTGATIHILVVLGALLGSQDAPTTRYWRKRITRSLAASDAYPP